MTMRLLSNTTSAICDWCKLLYIKVWNTKLLVFKVYYYLFDGKRIKKLPEFQKSLKNSINKEKSAMILTVDGRTNENIAPGRTVLNQRKIAVRKEFSGDLLEHEHFGSHLDHKENTIDAELDCIKSVRIWSYSGTQFSRIFPHLD